MMGKGVKVSFKVWLEYEGRPIIGVGGVKLLKLVDNTGSISKAAEEMGVSYKFAWSYIKSIEESLGVRIVKTYRGGKGGGFTKLTERGKKLVNFYDELLNNFHQIAKIFEDKSGKLLDK
ncbi:MAG: hypothetical protein DRJ44_02425 [Thermoprotei archaeon]|nr:MAG: hypothetical protein DRZ80_00255 [Thermoprotei archaeon]RLE77272.1 MAG: hypothetical protein DRJ44_02425 [Thermoprotei archaeon]